MTNTMMTMVMMKNTIHGGVNYEEEDNYGDDEVNHLNFDEHDENTKDGPRFWSGSDDKH